jgi:DNA-binding response OmpR family regulator
LSSDSYSQSFKIPGGRLSMKILKFLIEKIEEDSKKPIYIKTVWGVGYKV